MSCLRKLFSKKKLTKVSEFVRTQALKKAERPVFWLKSGNRFEVHDDGTLGFYCGDHQFYFVATDQAVDLGKWLIEIFDEAVNK